MTAPVLLPARLDSAAAVQLARDLREREGTPVTLDASQVDLLGARAVQTLLVAAAAWRAAGVSFAVVNLPDGVRGQLATLGLSDIRAMEGAAP
jgi:anti-anti-sigma regulatory factor